MSAIESARRPLLERTRAGLRRGELPDGPELAMLLHVACGLTVAFTTPFAPGVEHPTGAILVGLLAAVIGVWLPQVSWGRDGDSGQRWIIPEALLLVVAFNLMASAPFVFSLFYVVVWVWVGLSQAPGTAVRYAPLLIVAYVIPGLFVGSTAQALISAVYVVPVAVIVGETIAFVAEHLRLSRAAIEVSEARFAALIRHASEFVLILDDDGRIRFASESLRTILGWSPDELIGQRARVLLHPDDHDVVTDWYRRAREARSSEPLEFRGMHDDGTWRWIEGRIEDLSADSAIGGVVMNGRDISDRREAEADLEWTAFTDELTGLPNRASLHRRLQTLLDRADPVVVLLLDLDRFKRINDTLGHPMGDCLLQAVTSRLASSTTGLEYFRLGGDEFVAIGCDRTRAEGWADQLVHCFDQFFEFGGRRFQLTGSVGVVETVPGTSVTDVLRTVDLAMYDAKRHGGDRWSRFDDRMAHEAKRRLDIESDLRLAIVTDALDVHFQPEIDAETGHVVGAEALVRWLHPARGWLEPAEFLPIAEETGLIDRIGHIVVGRSLEAVTGWRRAGHDLFVSVNMSGRQLRDPGVIDFVVASLELWGVDPASLRIEITETALLEPDVAERVIPALRELGISIAVDGFGTGYSSLAQLQDLTVDTLKIDRSFLPADDAGDETPPLVGAVVAMAHGLGLSVVAEGVETEAQRRLLRQLGCSHLQGHLIAPPLPGRAFGKLLARMHAAAGLPDRDPAVVDNDPSRM